jgi:hypothetical protein
VCRSRLRAAAGLVGVVITVVALAACGDDDDGDGDAAAPEELCLVVQAWSDSTVDQVDAFREDSPGLDPDARRARYEEAFVDVADRQDEFVEHLDELDLPQPIAGRLDEALADVTETYDDGVAEAEALPDEAYSVQAVREGSLVGSVEKAKAIVFQALSELADDPATGIARGCGRRGALDLSPTATYPSS